MSQPAGDRDPATAAPATWLAVAPDDVATNLALDEALLEEAHEGIATGVVVRTWMAAAPTVVLGSSSRTGEEIDLAACERLGVRVVRRPSGGLTVVLGPGCLMWSVVVHHPAGAPGIEAIHAAMRQAAEGPMKGVLAYTEEELVSSDFIGCPASSTFDATLTQVIGERFAKVFSWYDNEWGFSNRMIDLAQLVTRKGL